MRECVHLQNRLVCTGVIENKSDAKLQMTFTGGSVIDDKGTQYPISGGPYYLGLPAIFVFGSANTSQDLMPNLPVKFGFEMQQWSKDASAFNFVVKLTTSGDPPESEILVKDIPIHEY
jgi:hypothetical protein